MIECIDSGSNKLITVGNKYEIISETENRYTILNDKDIQKNYSKNLFRNEETKVIEEISVETLVDIDLNEVGFNVNVKIEGLEEFRYNVKGVACINDTNISCGIKQLPGLNGIMKFEEDFRNDLKEYIEESNIQLGEDIDLDELCDETIASLFQDLLAELDGTCLYTLLSTNLHNNEYYNQNVVDILNDICENETLVGDNPNTGNEIQLWVLKCS